MRRCLASRMLILRSAHSGEVEELTELCLRSKAVWGYDDAFMEACRTELTITVESLTRSRIQVAAAEGCVVGVAQISMSGASAQLEKLFVEPERLSHGIGRILFDWCVSTARAEGATILVIDADPGAVEFYRRMGAMDDGSVASGSIPGRRIPRLRFSLSLPRKG